MEGSGLLAVVESKMGILKRSVVCHTDVVCANYVGSSAPLINIPFAKARNLQSGFWGSSCRLRTITRTYGRFLHPCKKKFRSIQSSFSSSSDGNGSIAGNFSENDEEYINSSVIEAVEVRSRSDGLMIKMRDGRHLRCVHNDPQAGNLVYYAPRPVIVLKMEDGSDILLPILVLEMPCTMLMAAISNVQLVRPTVYEVVREMIEKMGYAVQLVRVTKRVNEAYFAQLYLTKIGNGKDTISFDLRPSDAINIAARCKVPIQVNRHLVYSNGMRIVEPTKSAAPTVQSDVVLFTELDRPDDQPCYEAEEFDMLRNMMIASVEERYRDAARWRDKLFMFRAKRKNWT
ncbi:unnamed protein product [Musa textilis]